MDQKGKRGRPRAFASDRVSAIIRETFWTFGYNATSLDRLAAATGLSRSSLYGAFGDKQALYLAELDHVAALLDRALAEAHGTDAPIRDRLTRFFEGAIAVYTVGEAPRGCLVICTATVEAAANPAIAARLSDILAGMDRRLAALFADGVARGELSAHSHTDMLGTMCAAVLHSLAIRARAGTPSEQLLQLAQFAIDSLLPPTGMS